MFQPLRTLRWHAKPVQRCLLATSLSLLFGCAAPAQPISALRPASALAYTPAEAEAAAMAAVTAPLFNTYWKLMRFAGDVPPPVEPNQPEAHLVLESGAGRFHGAGGCNRLRGAYELQGERLSFAAISASRRACSRGMALEQAFIASLGRVARFEVQGQRLVMQDASGRELLQFEAVYLR